MNENKTTLFVIISYPEEVRELLDFNIDNQVFEVDCYCDEEKIYFEALTVICHHLAYGDKLRTAVLTQVLTPNTIFLHEEDYLALWRIHRKPYKVMKVDD